MAGEGFGVLHSLRACVERENACTLPGVPIIYENFIPVMWKAVAKGFVKHEHAVFVQDGLRNGFKAGVDIEKLKGHRWFRNYPTAMEAVEPVSRAIMKRVQAGKSLCLGPWSEAMGRALRATYPNTFIFPMSAAAKPLEPDEKRPTDDHTRTGLNAATDLSFLRHSLNTYAEISWFLKQDYFLRVSDVEGAFTILPLHPELWPYFMFRFFTDTDAQAMSLFVHLCGDFGAAGMPGTFKVFFVDVVVNMARAVGTLTIPLAVYVDDTGGIGPDADLVNADIERFQDWCTTVCGVAFKSLKDRMASKVQLMLGFWWDSRTLTRTLEERKLLAYVEMLAVAAGKEKLQLREMQVIAGRMQRAILTLPVGAACLLVGLFTLMAGLKMPWHTRRTTKGVRDDFRWLHRLLNLNMGKGFYSLANFGRAPECRTDASKSHGYAGGGWVSKCGRYSFFKYGSRASRQPIDHLEGDTVVDCMECMGRHWKHMLVPLGIDNMAFQRSLAKCRSKAPRLNTLIRECFALMVQFQCILDTFWLSSEDNLLADHLSRDREWEFLRDAVPSGFWEPGTFPLRFVGSGSVRRLPEVRGALTRANMAEAPEEPTQADPFRPVPPAVYDSRTRKQKPLHLRGAGPAVIELDSGSESEPDLEPMDEDPMVEAWSTWTLPQQGGSTWIDDLFAPGSQPPQVVPQHPQVIDTAAAMHALATLPPHPIPEMEEFLQSMLAGTQAVVQPALGVQPVFVVFAPQVTHFAWDNDPSYFEEDELELTTGMRLRGGGGSAPFNLSVPYTRASLFQGLPPGALERLEQVLDNRLSDSSWRTVRAGLTRWRQYCASEGFEPILPSDDPDRGGKLVGFVLLMLVETQLVYASIEHYVWGVRTWMKLQHQLDPVYGVVGWSDFMDAIKVLAWVPGEPRRQTPIHVVEAILDSIDEANFVDVQFRVLLLALLYTFSRSECPCPKSYEGREAFTVEVHWSVCDFDVQVVLRGTKRIVAIRFWRIKQDQRVERPEAQGEGDWSNVAELPGSKWCLLEALLKLNSMHDWPRDPKGPMFVTEPGAAGKPLLYRHLLKTFKEKQIDVGVPADQLSGPSGLRTLGYMRCKRGLGTDLTVAHGLWRSNAHHRYDRFTTEQVCRIAAVVAGMDAGDPSDGERAERDARPPAARLQRTLAGPAAPQPATLPEGWEEAEAEGEATVDGTTVQVGCYFGPSGEVACSVDEVWRMHNEALAEAEAAQLQSTEDMGGPSGLPPPLPSPRPGPAPGSPAHTFLEESVARNLACLGNLRERR